MKILFIGDIVGKPGREAVKKILPNLKKEKKIDFVIANAENLSHGKGFTTDTIEEMMTAGIDYFTSGNHIWDNKTNLAKLDDKSFPLLRPANFPPGVYGRGCAVVETGMMKKILIINLMGRVFMKHYVDCPFRALDKILQEYAHENLQAIFVDFHAEATSEKVALAQYADGRVSAFTGTHTHVPTADHRILNNGTAYVSDAGMTGPIDSVIGMDKNNVIRNFLTQFPYPFQVPEDGPKTFNSVLFEIDSSTKQAVAIERADYSLE